MKVSPIFLYLPQLESPKNKMLDHPIHHKFIKVTNEKHLQASEEKTKKMKTIKRNLNKKGNN